MSDLANLKPTIRLSIMNPDAESGSLFGRGIASLCLGVRETGSLNAAAIIDFQSIGIQIIMRTVYFYILFTPPIQRIGFPGNRIQPEL